MGRVADGSGARGLCPHTYLVSYKHPSLAGSPSFITMGLQMACLSLCNCRAARVSLSLPFHICRLWASWILFQGSERTLRGCWPIPALSGKVKELFCEVWSLRLAEPLGSQGCSEPAMPVLKLRCPSWDVSVLLSVVVGVLDHLCI